MNLRPFLDNTSNPLLDSYSAALHVGVYLLLYPSFTERDVNS